MEGENPFAGNLENARAYSSTGTGTLEQKSDASHEAYLAKVKLAQAHIELLKAALTSFHLDVGRYPTAQEGLGALQTRPLDVNRWKGPYLRNGLPHDPWGNLYVYISPGKMSHYEIESYGADAQPGGSNENADIHGDG